MFLLLLAWTAACGVAGAPGGALAASIERPEWTGGGIARRAAWAYRAALLLCGLFALGWRLPCATRSPAPRRLTAAMEAA
jgi:hypothetical protein